MIFSSLAQASFTLECEEEDINNIANVTFVSGNHRAEITELKSNIEIDYPEWINANLDDNSKILNDLSIFIVFTNNNVDFLDMTDANKAIFKDALGDMTIKFSFDENGNLDEPEAQYSVYPYFEYLMKT